MTDTITTEVVDTTITSLREALTKAQERLGEEHSAFIAKRDAMVTVAHSRGTSNNIGSSLDDLLEEFDLPRRGEAVTMHGLLMVSAPIDTAQTSGFYVIGSNYVYTQPGTRVTWPIQMEWLTNVPQGATCACEGSVEVAVRAYMNSYFGPDRVSNMHFQIGAINCGASGGCVNGETHRYEVTGDHGIDWTTKPVIVHTQPTPPVPPPAGTTPQVGETWYMVGNDTHYTGCRDGEPVVILNTAYRTEAPLQVRRASTGETWELLTNEVRAMASADPQVGQTWYLVGRSTYGASNEDGDPVIIVTATRGQYNVRRPQDVDGTIRWHFRREHLRATPTA